MIYAIIAQETYSRLAVMFILWVGWSGGLNSITLLLFLFVDNVSSPSLFEIISVENQKVVI